MAQTIEIEVEDDGTLNTDSSFDLATTVVILEKVKSNLVKRSQVKKRGEDDE